MTKLPKTRWGAFAYHLAISAVIFALLALVIYYWLFPGALFKIAGGIDGIKIVAGVDIVLGPLLTLVIYNLAKPRRELLRDLSIIGTIQIAALSAGMYLVYQSRPAAVTYIYDTFYTTKTGEFADADRPLPADLNWLTPQFYALELPPEPDDAVEILAQFELSGEQPRLRSDLYRPLSGSADAVFAALRADAQPAENSAADCVYREVISAFDSAHLCFDVATFRFRFRASAAHKQRD